MFSGADLWSNPLWPCNEWPSRTSYPHPALSLSGRSSLSLPIPRFVAWNPLLKSFPPNELTFRVYQLRAKARATPESHASSAAASPSLLPLGKISAPAAAGAPVLQPSRAPDPVKEIPVSATAPPPARSARNSHTPHVSPRPFLNHSPQEFQNLPHADLETLIGGRWLNRIGIIALLFAVSYSSSSPSTITGSVPPAGSPSASFLARSCFLGALAARRGYSYFSEGIAGLGKPRSSFLCGRVASTTRFRRGKPVSSRWFWSPSSWRLLALRRTPRASPSSRSSAACLHPRSSAAAKISNFVLFSYLLFSVLPR